MGVMPTPQLPNRECHECGISGNRFLQHIETNTRTGRYHSGEVPRRESVAIFRCSKNRGHRPLPEAFDPDAILRW